MLPPTFAVRPRHTILPAEAVLWRVHDRRWQPAEFNTSVEGVGRFSPAAAAPYPYLYAAPEETTALAETFLRNRPFEDRGDRCVLRRAVQGKKLSAFETAREIRLVSLISAADLAAVGAEEWLVHAGEAEYEKTRQWAHWLWQQDNADGLVWMSRRDRPNPALVLFGDRCGGALRPFRYRCHDLDSADGVGWFNEVMRPYRLYIAEPS